MNAHPMVIGPRGEQPLGSFLRQCKDASGLPVTKIVEAAGISRANYYLLEKDNQRPSLATMVALLGAMGHEVSIPSPGGGDAVDLVVTLDGDRYDVDLRWSAEERAKSRDRYIATTASGVVAALGAASALRPGAAAIGSGSLAVGGGAVAGPLLPLAGVIGTVMGQAAFMAARRLADRRARRDNAQVQVERVKSEVLAEVERAADAMSTDDLEELLALMKAMQEVQANDHVEDR